MKRRARRPPWARSVRRQFEAFTRQTVRAVAQTVAKAIAMPSPRRTPAAAPGLWMPGVVLGVGGARRFRLYRPPGLAFGERLPVMVMLHGCGQDADSFAASTRMNRIALRERFLVLYPEQDRLANGHGCWNWFEVRSGRAGHEATLILEAIDQVCRLHGGDRGRVAITGLSAGASMAALLVTRQPARFRALVMHSGVPPGTASSAASAVAAMHGLRRTAPLAATPEAMAAAWPPLLVIHGAADAVVSPHNGVAAVQAWATAGGARAGAVRSLRRGQRYPMSVVDFKRQGRTVATLVAVDGLAHAWSGGAASQASSDARGPDASRMAWAFAARQMGA
jgi:poly(hydroxyalkanoate) depolymerase family esterase